MSKATIGLLVLLFSSLAAFGQNEPQWKVVQHGMLFHQTAAIPFTPLFTPTKTGFYRMSVYISSNDINTNWQIDLLWTDFAGTTQKYASSPTGAPPLGSFMFVPRAGTQVSYQVIGNDPNVPYNIAFTIEQLQ
jgi:hypothetical protein